MSEAFFQALVGSGFLTEANAVVLRRFVEVWKISPFHAVLQTHLMPEEQLADALASTAKVDRVYNVSASQIDEAAAAAIGYRKSRAWECLPIKSEHNDGKVELVIADPTQSERIAALRRLINTEITLSVAERSDIVKAIDELYPLPLQLPSLMVDKKPKLP